MKYDKKLVDEFRKTKEGKKYYTLNVVSYILGLLSIVSLCIVIFNEGNTLSGLLTGLNVIAYVSVAVAVAMSTAYYFSLSEFINKNKK